MNIPADKSDPVNLTPSLSDLDDVEREERLHALRSMLAATEARQSKMRGVRNKTLAAGLIVKIRSGSYMGATGIILDADYIHSKVEVQLHAESTKTWLNFSEVSPVATSNEEASNPLQSE